MVRNFKDLIVWQRSFKLSIDVYNITESFPKSEIFGITQQIRRSSVSVPSNIAEGFRRLSRLEYRHFLYIALGSAGELETQLRISERLGYLKDNTLIETTEELCRMLTALAKKVTLKAKERPA